MSMTRRSVPIILALIVAGTTAYSSPRGLEFSTDTLPGDKETFAVSFSTDGGEVGTCYTLVDPMGKTVAAACLGESGWDLHGGRGWVFSDGGRLVATFEKDPGISRIYTDDTLRVCAELGAKDWSAVNPGEIIRKAKAACAERGYLPSSSGISIAAGSDGYEVVFMGSDGGGEAFCRAMVLIDRKSGGVAWVSVP